MGDGALKSVLILQWGTEIGNAQACSQGFACGGNEAAALGCQSGQGWKALFQGEGVDIVLYEANIICEYLDERFPHPQLMPAEPVMRARVRLFLFNFERELFTHVRTLESSKTDEVAKQAARAAIHDQLTAMSPVFLKNKYIFGEEFTMLDVVMAPLLWRLGYYGIDLPPSAAPLQKYAERLFSRQSFIDSMTPSEKVMRR